MIKIKICEILNTNVVATGKLNPEDEIELKPQVTGIVDMIYVEQGQVVQLQTKPMISIVNVVASASVDQRMDLNDITRKFPDVEYHPDVFPGLVFRLKTPKSATLIFSSGKMVCTGSKSEELAKKAVKTVVQQLRKGKLK